RGAQLLDGLQQLAVAHPNLVIDVRGRGLMVGVGLDSAGVAARLRGELLERCVIVSTCGPDSSSLRLSPPLVIREEQVSRFINTCRDILQAW
ncbi:MAG: aminotransferase class III-fold pyridoxal phosphate-dependent enzyme, partial [Gaiellaceae bacterium]